ncbi:MAG TPA: hypothetical protein VKE96_09480 [Vicinamibacterales bacterium]|nr:hypothetical protein [Vicinamibacterales bacterium]
MAPLGNHKGGPRLRSGGRLIALAALLFLASIVWSQCSKPAQPPTPSSAPLLGDMKAVVSVKELMANMIDPLADNIFDAVWWENGPNGMVEHRPNTDEDWQRVSIGAVTIAEGIYLLKVPRPFAPPGDVNNSVGANAPELAPAQIKAKLDKDPVLWNAKIEALRNVALETLDAVKRKDVDALFQAGADLDVACEECHLEYWYPADRPTVLQERKARATYVKPGASAQPPGQPKK